MQQVEQLRALSKKFGGHATQWLKRAQEVLDQVNSKGV